MPKKKQTNKRRSKREKERTKQFFNKTTETQKIKKVRVVDILIKKDKRQ